MIDIGSRLEPLVDRYLIDEMNGTRLELGRPQPAGVALRFDKPWEGRWAGCATVLRDEDRFRMYYRGMPRTGNGTDVECTCYAESPDGVHWDKPRLDLYEYNGIRPNNIVVYQRTPASHNFCPFLDRRPGAPEGERFKAMGGTWRKGMRAFVSADGLHWRPMSEEPVVTSEGPAFDSQNVPFWSESEGCYVFYFRTFHKHPGSDIKRGFRWVSRRRSDDFLHWSESQEMEAGDAPREEIYTQQTHPYFRAPHLYISLAARFWPQRQALTEEQIREIDVHEQYSHDCSDAVLMTSRGGNRYDRTFLESFIRPGADHGNWVSRANYPALGVVPTTEQRMSLYVQRHYAQPTGFVERMTLRTDGFVALHASYAGGEMVTRPLCFSGGEMVLNCATSAAGSVRVEIQDETGQPLPGYSLEDASEIIGDEIDRAVAWPRAGGADLGDLAGRPVRLRFRMKDADIYSFRFRPDPAVQGG